MNLFVNASQSIPSEQEGGKVVVSMAVLPTEDIPSPHRDKMSMLWEKYITISVKDNGCGMDEDTQNQMFNAFFTTKKKDQVLGLGLGLAVVAQITEAHKGYIFVSSEEGVGSEFFLYFPVVQGENVAKQLGKEGEKCRILFVADKSKVMDDMEKSLNKIQVSPLFTSNTEDAKELLKTNIAVLIIEKDLTTAKGSERGLHFSMAIHNLYPDVVKILLVDKVDKDILDAKDQGLIHDFIKKPVTSAKLFDKLRHILM